jgi:predicted adenylyl cyclase CyaB
MAQNIEIKARVADLHAIEAAASALADRGPVTLEQDDTFFACPNGRLKLRELGPGQAELIFYQRPDVTGPKLSTYLIVPVAQPDLVREMLTHALGAVGRVRKRRRVYFVGQTRVHLDEVRGLGSFLELEVVLAPEQSAEQGQLVARALLTALGVEDTDLLAGAYVDLLFEALR